MFSKYLPLFPEQASSMAGQVDALYFFIVAVTVVFTVLVALMVLYFSIKYRKAANPIATQIEGSVPLEIIWSVVPLAIAMVIFVWGSVLYFNLMRAPADAMDVFVVGKQWMWKAQHPSGVREINQLHVPVGRPVRLTMISQDVLHSFFVPAFRIKHDVLPGRYTYVWFTATKPGTYHLFCAEYCGTKHSGMIGEVIAMEPSAYQSWLAGGEGEGSMASNGEKLFTNLGCITCHSGESGSRGPNLAGVYGSQVRLANGTAVMADDNYMRESILHSQAKIVAGYEPIMPTFAGQVNEEGLASLIAYIKAMPAPDDRGTAAPKGGTAPAKNPGAKQ